MADTLTSLFGRLTGFLRSHAYSIPAVVLIVALGISYWLFYTSSIEPALSARNVFVTQVIHDQKALQELRGKTPESAHTLQLRVTAANSTLAASVSTILTDSEANQVIAGFYQDARASGVTITLLQSQNPVLTTPTPTRTAVKPSPTPQPAPTQTGPAQSTPIVAKGSQGSPTPASTLPPTTSPADFAQGQAIVALTHLKMQAQGTSRQLVDFVSRLKGQFAKGEVINDLSLTGGDGIATLTLDISIYISYLSAR